MIPYQPTFGLKLKHGNRYGPQSFAPPVSNATMGTMQPAVMTTGAGQTQASAQPAGHIAAPTTPTYTVADDPFATSAAAQPVTQTVAPAAEQPVAVPPPTAAPPAVTPYDAKSTQGRMEAAKSLGYTEPAPFDPSGMMGFIPGGNLAAEAMGIEMGPTNEEAAGKYTPEGFVYGPEGRAYNPVTGKAENVYANKGAFKSGFSEGYSKLREAGESAPSAFLGSYENSIYKQKEGRPDMTDAQARAARLRGEGAPIETVAGYTDFGTMPGQPVATEFGIGTLNESGTISTPGGGTVVALTNTADPSAGNISLLNTSGAGQLAAQQELERRSSSDDDNGMAGFVAKDSSGGNYRTDSSGTSGAFTGGVTGMEDEYDEPSDDNSGGGK